MLCVKIQVLYCPTRGNLQISGYYCSQEWAKGAQIDDTCSCCPLEFITNNVFVLAFFKSQLAS